MGRRIRTTNFGRNLGSPSWRPWQRRGKGTYHGIPQQEDHPILRGVKDIWVASDVYTVKNLVPEAHVLVYGVPTSGMTADAPVNWEKSVMPMAWTKDYQVEGGKKGMVFTTTMGASVDLIKVKT
jgi:hypothetical protein